MNKKILFLLPDLYYGGAQKTIINLVNDISLDSKFSVDLLVINGSNCVYKINKKIKVIDLKSKRLRFSIFTIFSYLLANNYQVVFSTTFHINIINIFLKIFLFKKNSKHIIRETNPTFFRNDLHFFYKLSAKILYRYADKIISLSPFVTNQLKKNLYVHNDKIVTIGNPVDFEDILKKSNLPINDNDVKFDKSFFYICFCGRLSYQKNIKLLIEISTFLNLKKIKILIIGVGPEKDNLIKLTKKYNISKSFIFLGFKNNPYKYISRSNLFILTSFWEGFGHVIVESLVCKTPVICCNTVGINNDFLGGKEVQIFQCKETKDIGSRLHDIINNYDTYYKNFNPSAIYEMYEVSKISTRYKDEIYNFLK